MIIEDWMGLLLFIFGLTLIIIAFLSAIAVFSLISGLQILGFSIFGFILCITGFMMAHTIRGGVMGRFRR